MSGSGRCIWVLMTAFNTSNGLRWNAPRPVVWQWLPVLAAGLLGLVTGSSVRAQAPLLTGVSPASGATGVAVTSVIRFTFDRAMDDLVPVIASVPPFVVGNLDFTPADVWVDTEWSADRKTLTCTPGSDLPPSTTITWKLNPAGSMFPLKSSTGVVLATATGSFSTATGGGGGDPDPAPQLVHTTPGTGNADVAVDTAVSFYFDVPMKPDPEAGLAVRWFGDGVDPAKFTYLWGADGQILTAHYEGDLPAQTLVAWTLNPEDAEAVLESEAGVPLEQVGGAFTTGAAGGGGEDDCVPDGIPEDWGSYTVMKQGQYVQTSPADPVPISESPFLFGAMVIGPDAGPAAVSGAVTLPGGEVRPLDPAGFGGMLMAGGFPATEAALDASYPGGTYVLRFTQTGQAERVLNLPVPAANPPVPKVANYAAAQTIKAAADFTLEWNAFTGASGMDWINLVITGTNLLFATEVVFQAPDLCVPRLLPATATSVVIPANTFRDNRTYNAVLTYNRAGYMDTNAIAKMAGFSGVARSTEFTLRTGTGGTAPAAARFIAYRLLPNGNPELTLSGTAGHGYTVLRAPNLSGAAWGVAGVVTLNAAGQGVFEDVAPNKVLPFFYQALSN